MNAADCVRVRWHAALWLLATLTFLVGCEEEQPKSGVEAVMVGDAVIAASSPLCVPGAVVSCACVAGGVGTQTCLPAGNGYSACGGCPAPTAMDMGTQAPPTGVTASGVGGSMMSSAQSAPGTLVVPEDGGEQGGAGSPAETGDSGEVLQTEVLGVAPAGSEPGTSCGVGLPVLCALETEQCCIRSLATDSCIASGESCTCDYQGCTTTIASCDGPEDCGDGQVCCGTLTQSRFGGFSNNYDGFECTSQCDSVGNNSSQREACHEDEDSCPGGTVCANSQILTNVQICINPASIEQ